MMIANGFEDWATMQSSPTRQPIGRIPVSLDNCLCPALLTFLEAIKPTYRLPDRRTRTISRSVRSVPACRIGGKLPPNEPNGWTAKDEGEKRVTGHENTLSSEPATRQL